MDSQSSTVVVEGQTMLNVDRRLFFTHVGSVVVTAMVVVSLLLGINSIPWWLSVACCIVIGFVATSFVAVVANGIRAKREMQVFQRIECLALALSLSTLQAIFIFPVLICIYAPTLRL